MTQSPQPGPASRVVTALAGRGLTLAVAESLTGGALTAEVVAVPGASAVLRGGVVAYATDLKTLLLGVDAALLAERGAVDPEVASQMADGVRTRLVADVGVSTTGVAGPAWQGAHPPGTVHVAVVSAHGERVRSVFLPGPRPTVRTAAVDLALSLLLEELADPSWPA